MIKKIKNYMDRFAFFRLILMCWEAGGIILFVFILSPIVLTVMFLWFIVKKIIGVFK